MCSMDCFNCTKPDCDVDGVTFSEKWEQDKQDRKIELDQADEKRKRIREYQRKYDKSEKGRARAKRVREKRIANGKNAESCRAYYYRQKQKNELMKEGA